MEAQQQRTGIFGMEPLLHDPCPKAPRRAELGNLFEKIVVRIKEK